MAREGTMVVIFVSFMVVMVGASGRSVVHRTDDLALPLMDEVKAALTANIDVSALNVHLKNFIEMEITNQVKQAMNDTRRQVLNDMSGLKDEIEQTNKDTWIQMYQNLAADNKQLKQNLETDNRQLKQNLAASNKQFEMKQNLAMRNLEQRIDNEFKPVVLTACHLNVEYREPGIIKFPTIKTSVGVPDLSAYQSTGKFTCHEPGFYYVMTTIESQANNGQIGIMVNSTEQHRQYVTGYTKDGNYWTPGAATITLNLKANDQVWINLIYTKSIFRSCLNIFKIK